MRYPHFIFVSNFWQRFNNGIYKTEGIIFKLNYSHFISFSFMFVYSSCALFETFATKNFRNVRKDFYLNGELHLKELKEHPRICQKATCANPAPEPLELLRGHLMKHLRLIHYLNGDAWRKDYTTCRCSSCDTDYSSSVRYYKPALSQMQLDNVCESVSSAGGRAGNGWYVNYTSASCTWQSYRPWIIFSLLHHMRYSNMYVKDVFTLRHDVLNILLEYVLSITHQCIDISCINIYSFLLFLLCV